MCQALSYLESPQEPVREAALRFIGITGKYLRKGQEEDELITEVALDTLQGMTADSPAISKRVAKTMEILKDFRKSKPKPKTALKSTPKSKSKSTPKSKSTRFR